MAAKPVDSRFLQLLKLARGGVCFEEWTRGARCVVLVIAVGATDFIVCACAVFTFLFFFLP
jgi:hypothetical protein